MLLSLYRARCPAHGFLVSLKTLARPLLLLLFPFVSLRAQTPACDSLRPVQGSQSQYKDRGNRCEGLYVADVGTLTLEILSLTQSDISFSLNPGEVLRVSAPASTANLHLRAVAKPPKTYYRLDASLAPGATLNWPVDAVLLPENIGSSRIGIFAFREEGTQRIFVPVRVSSSAPSDRSASHPTLLSIRPSFDADLIKWRWSLHSQGLCSKFAAWQDASTLSVDAGQSVNILLKGIAGRACVEVAAKAHNKDEWPTLKLFLELPSP